MTPFGLLGSMGRPRAHIVQAALFMATVSVPLFLLIGETV